MNDYTLSLSAERSTSNFSFRDSISRLHFSFLFSFFFSTAFNRGTMESWDVLVLSWISSLAALFGERALSRMFTGFIFAPFTEVHLCGSPLVPLLIALQPLPGIPRRDRKTYPRSPFLTFLRWSINNSKKERRKGFSRRSIDIKEEEDNEFY